MFNLLLVVNAAGEQKGRTVLYLQWNAVGESKGKLIVYTTFGHEWRKFGNPRHRRPIESVVLPQVCGSCSRWRWLCQHSDHLGCCKHWCVCVGVSTAPLRAHSW